MVQDHKTVWSHIRSLGGQAIDKSLPPVRNSEGELVTEAKEILKIIREHYRNITDYNPENLSKNKEHWAGIDLGEPKERCLD